MYRDIKPVTSLICLATNFCIIFCVKKSRLMGWYPLAWVHLAFPGAGISVVLTFPLAVDIYISVLGTLFICTYFWYLTTDFDTLRTLCFNVSIITVWISMCTASKTRIDCAFQVSLLMAVTSSFGWGDSCTKDIFKSYALGHPGNA